MIGRGSLRALVVLCLLLSTILGTLVRPLPALAAAPQTPENQSPSDGATGVSLTPTLQASGFIDEDDDSHVASRWRIGGEEYESSSQLTSFQVESGVLSYSTTYSWQVCYTDNAGDTSAWSDAWSFKTMDPAADPPAVTTAEASGIGSTTATLHGNLADLGTAGSVSVSFQWGTSESYGNTESAGTMTETGAFSASLGGLAPETTYHFRAVATSDDGADEGNDLTFTTDAAPTQAPSVTTVAASGIGPTSATISGNLDSLGTASSVTVSFQWGTSDSYGNTESAGTMTGEGAFSFALSGLSPNTTYYFRAVATSGDGTDYGDGLTFLTGSVPTEPPSVSTELATAVETTSATLNGNLSSMGTASSVSVSFQWGTSESYGNTESAGTMTETGAFSAELGSLTPGTIYHYRAVATSDYGTVYGDPGTFTTDPLVAPGVTTAEATGFGSTSATLNGNLTDMGTADSVDVYFKWGLTTGYGSTTVAQGMTAEGGFSASLTGLTAGTTYHFQAVAVGDDTAYGADRTFTTVAAPTEDPAVTTVAASGIATISAELNLNLTDKGTAESVQVSFQWGLTTGYGYTTPAQAMDEAGSLSYAVTGLAPETTYHFRAVAVGDGTAYGNDLTFTTEALPEEPAEVTTTAASAIGSSSATLGLNLSSLGSAASVDVYTEWGQTTAYGSTTARKTVSRTGASSFAVSGLTPATTYHFRAVVVGDGTAYGNDLTFTTVSADPVPPAVTTVDAASIGTNSATLNLGLTAVGSAAAVQVSFQWGPTADYGQTTEAVAMSGPGSFSQPISGLAAATTYHFRAVATGDGTAYGGDLVFTTASTPPVAPRVKTGDAGSVTGASARLNGELSSLGTAASVTVSFAWGTAPGGPYLNQTQGTARTDGGAFYFDLDGLAPGTVYYFRAMAVGDGNAMGVEKSFVTVGQAPRIDSLTAYSSREGDPLTVKITGANLSSVTRVDLGQGIRVVEFTVVSDGEIRARIEVESGAESVVREVTVTTPTGIATHTVPAGFLAGFSGESAKEGGPRIRLWVYTAVIAVVAVVSVLVALEVWLSRRSDRRRNE